MKAGGQQRFSLSKSWDFIERCIAACDMNICSGKTQVTDQPAVTLTSTHS